VFAAATDFGQVFRIAAVFAAILVVIRDRTTATRMRAGIVVLLVSHLESPSFKAKVKRMGAY
jgi:hypothetical protein